MPWVWVGLAWGGALLSKYHAVLIPLGTALYVLLHRPMRRWLFRPGPYLALGDRADPVQPGPGLECRPRLGVVPVPGGTRGGRLDAPARLLCARHPGPGRLPVPVDLGTAGRHPGQGCRDGGDHLGSGAALALPGGRSARFVHRGGVFSPGPAALGLDRAGVAVPDPGTQLGRALEKQPQPTRGACRLRLLFIGDSGRLRSSSTATAGSSAMAAVGGDSSTREPIRRSTSTVGTRSPTGSINSGCSTILGAFVFTRYWYQSAQIAYALGRDRPVLCYNADDPRGFAFWSRPEEWIGRDGVLVVVGEIEPSPWSLLRPMVHEVEPVSEFWVERGGKPVRRIRLYRCRDQRFPFPYGMDRAQRLAKEAARKRRHSKSLIGRSTTDRLRLSRRPEARTDVRVSTLRSPRGWTAA